MTLSTVSNLGFAPGAKALYRFSRPSPVSLATCVIPRARAMCPIARRTSSASPSASTCDRYSLIISSLSSHCAASKRDNFSLMPQVLCELSRCRMSRRSVDSRICFSWNNALQPEKREFSRFPNFRSPPPKSPPQTPPATPADDSQRTLCPARRPISRALCLEACS